MEEAFAWISVHFFSWHVLAVPITVLVSAAIQFFVWSLVRRRGFLARSSIAGALNSSVRLLIWVVSLSIGIAVAPESTQGLTQAKIAARIGLIIAATWLTERLLVTFFKQWAQTRRLTTNLQMLAVTLFRAGLFMVTAATVLDTLGVAITPLLASLGIGSLAVALALQDTLGNLFSGLYLLADNPIRMGDFVRLDSGEEGFVERIGWRSTQVRLLANNMVIVPNSKLAGARLTNYSMPDPETAILVEMSVAYDSDLDLVEKTAIAAAKQTLSNTEGGIPSFEPFIRYHTFAASSIDFTVILRARHFTDGYLIKHNFIKAAQRAFAERKIEIPFPQRVVHTHPDL